jgi:hypothetical protein
MKIRFRTDVEQGGERLPRQLRSVNPMSPWSPRGPVSSGTPPTQNPADKFLRRGAAFCARFSAAEEFLRTGAACCARFSAADESLRRGAGACALFASRASSRGCARCSAVDQRHSLADPKDFLRRGTACCARRSLSDRRHPLADSRSIAAIRLPLVVCPQFDHLSNRNWPTNRSYRKQTIKPCLTGTRIAHLASRTTQRDARCDSSESSIPIGLPLRRNR